MGSFASLPSDQRAVLELVLRRGRTYHQIAQVLSIDRAGVRQRALAALDALGPQTRVPAERRALITDYLLGALPAGVAEEVHRHLGQSASERAWARAVSAELQPIAEHPLPEVPSATASGAVDALPEPETSVAGEVDGAPGEHADAGAATAPADGDAAAPGSRVSSRRGGALLLAAGAAVIVAVVLILVLPGGGHKHGPAQARAATGQTGLTGTTGASGTTGTTGAKVVAAIALKPPSGGKTPLGFAEVLQAQGQFGVAIAAQGLAANKKHPPDAYAVWLYNSPGDSHILGFVSPAVGSNGILRTAGGLPKNASHYQKLLVTLETSSHPKAPGRIILEGNLRL
jgi:hypothetical protein